MTEEEWEHLISALIVHGYLPDVVQKPPTLVVRGERGTKMIRRHPMGDVSVSVWLDDVMLARPTTVEMVLKHVGDTIGAPVPFDLLMTTAAQAFGIKVIRPDLSLRIRYG
jgi:hypothetical protein